MRVIIFGGSGFLGSHVSDALQENGHDVIIYDMKESPYASTGQRAILGDILDPKQVMAAVDGCDTVYNFAGIADLDDARTRPIDTINQNILGNANILEACIAAKVKRYVYASTIYVYSEKGGFYRCSKQAAESYIEEYNRKYGLPFTILRFGTVYGPRADRRNSIYRYLRAALTKGIIEVHGSGEEHREYIHVKDAAWMSVKILDGDYENEHITLTGHQSMKFKDLLRIISEILNNKIEIKYSGIDNGAHYEMTPYSYTPKIGHKMTSKRYIDLGQGLLQCLAEIDQELSER